MKGHLLRTFAVHCALGGSQNSEGLPGQGGGVGGQGADVQQGQNVGQAAVAVLVGQVNVAAYTGDAVNLARFQPQNAVQGWQAQFVRQGVQGRGVQVQQGGQTAEQHVAGKARSGPYGKDCKAGGMLRRRVGGRMRIWRQMCAGGGVAVRRRIVAGRAVGRSQGLPGHGVSFSLRRLMILAAAQAAP